MFSKVALITGSARRIGAQIAKTLHQHGYRVIIHCRTAKIEAELLAKTFNQQQKDTAFVLCADLSDSSALQHFMKQAFDLTDRLDLLVNNASSFYPTPINNVTESQWDDLHASNVKAPFFLAQAAYPLLKQYQGNIINIVDIHAQKPMRNYSAYCIAKAGLQMATQALAKEMSPEVRVNGVSPGAIVWPEGENSLDTVNQQKLLAKIPLKRHGHPQDIANAVLFLATQPYITGEILNVDGGRSLNI